jgi:hypothetical protein
MPKLSIEYLSQIKLELESDFRQIRFVASTDEEFEALKRKTEKLYDAYERVCNALIKAYREQ